MRRIVVLVVAALAAMSVITSPPAQAAAPGAPEILDLQAGPGQVTITFTPGTGATSTTYSIDGGAPSAPVTSPVTITGLTDGSYSCFTLSSTNADGTGSASSPRCAIPGTLANMPGPSVITVSQSAPNTAQISYAVTIGGVAVTEAEIWLDGAFLRHDYVFASPLTLTGLTPDVEHVVKIKLGTVGYLPDSNFSNVVTFIVSGSPTPEPAGSTGAPSIGIPEPPGVTITATTRDSVSFTLVPPGNNGGQAPTGYRFNIDGKTTEVSPTQLTQTVTGLRPGVVYTVTANAANSAGWSAPGVATATTGAATLSKPLGIRVTPGVRNAIVQWDPPADLLAAESVQYVASVGKSIASQSCVAPAGTRSCTIERLSPGTPYEVRVIAVNAGGDGTAGIAPFTTLPAPPENPTNFTVVPNTDERRSVRVSWNRPEPAGRNLRYSLRVTRIDKDYGYVACAGTAGVCIVNDVMPNTPYRYTLRMLDGTTSVFQTSEVFTLSTAMPHKPRTPAAVQVGDRMKVTWTEPVNADRNPPYGYVVHMFADDIDDSIGHLYDEQVCKVAPQTHSCMTHPLKAGLHYRFDVFALDDDDFRTDPSATDLVPLMDMPVPPITLADAANGAATVTVIDRASVRAREASSFRVLRVDDWFGIVTVPACTIVLPKTSCTVSGLENGTGYRFVAYALNAAGESAAGMPSQVVEPSTTATPPTPPSAPRNAAATSRVAITIPADGSIPGVSAGTFLEAVPYIPGTDIWVTMTLRWDPPANTGGARDIVYTASLLRFTDPSVHETRPEGSERSFHCVTRERSCEIRFPYRSDLRLPFYWVSIGAANAAGKAIATWELTKRGALTPLS